MIISAVPFERECASTIYISGTLAVVRADMPVGISDPTPYLADLTDTPVKLFRC